MRITYLPSNVGAAGPATYLTTYLVNETLAIDAGCLGFWGTPTDQARVTDIVLTHSHVDHIASLPIFLLNVYRPGKSPVRVHASAPVLESLEKYYLTDSTWLSLDFMRRCDPPMIETFEIESGRAFRVGGLAVLPISVDHTVPTLGVLLQDQTGSVAITSDTGPTDAFWREAAKCPDLRAVFIEASFPDSLEALALESGHLTPKLVAGELAKLGRSVWSIAMHVKPAYYERVVADLARLGQDNIEVVEPGRMYTFD